MRAAPAKEGDRLTVDGQLFELGRELGRGNFGVVFEAEGRDEPAPVAVKVSEVDPELGFKERTREALRLLTECTILKRLNGKLRLRGLPEAEWRVPRYLGHTGTPSKVTLVMTKAEGVPLDKFLYGTDGHSFGDLAPGSHFGSMDFASACSWVASMLSQMAPVFSVLERVAFHRDISSANFLVHDDGSGPAFAMIDLGLAVEVTQWREDWRISNIAGDPRYWSPAHWAQMFLGWEHLENQEPMLARLYRERVDHYSFGILLLEAIFALWRGPWGEASARRAPQALVEAWVAWQHYWHRAETLQQTFRSHMGDDLALHSEIVHAGLCESYTAAHCQLCRALRAAAADRLAASARMAGSKGPSAAPLLLAAVELIDPHSVLSWNDVPDLLLGNTDRFLPASRVS